MNNRKSSCSIALMSGKGGSGKTTLALSMASMLSSSNVKTLLIDCDLSTNGATYFFEDEMAYSVNNIDTLQELMLNQNSQPIKTYHVNQFFDFLPSVTIIGEYYNHDELTWKARDFIENLFVSLKDKYDVIIYDCQAGFSQLLEIVIRHVDRNLMVLEADSVSASAVRNLFLKLNKAWNKSKVYQVFNKATKEEAEIYSKVTSGTTFDNIGCILFDWTVRRAFSTSQIPDMEHTSIDYGHQIGELCNALIRHPSINHRLNCYIAKRKLDEMNAIEAEVEKEIKQLTDEKMAWDQSRKRENASEFRKRLMIIIPILLSLIATIISLGLGSVHLEDRIIMEIMLGICIAACFIYASNYFFHNGDRDESSVKNLLYKSSIDFQLEAAYKKQSDSRNQIINLEKKISQLENMIAKDKSNKSTLDNPNPRNAI